MTLRNPYFGQRRGKPERTQDQMQVLLGTKQHPLQGPPSTLAAQDVPTVLPSLQDSHPNLETHHLLGLPLGVGLYVCVIFLKSFKYKTKIHFIIIDIYISLSPHKYKNIQRAKTSRTQLVARI